ncbi:type II secretion system F family protein [Micromonospora sp. NPDC003197]
MTANLWLLVSCLLGAALVAGWPVGSSRARRRAIIEPQPDQRSADQRRSADRQTRIDRRIHVGRQWMSLGQLAASPRRTTISALVFGGGVGAWLGGPVASIAVAAYTGLAVGMVLRRQKLRLAAQQRRRQLDGLSALAADLRAGLPVPGTISQPPLVTSAVASVATSAKSVPAATLPKDDDTDRITSLTRSAIRLAEQTGAPLADLLERIEADARATDRGLAAAAAQAAGARATAWLLAGLPLGGIALGFGIGVDPVSVLLHTPIGAGCTIAAIGLQFAGLAWANRLSSSATRGAVGAMRTRVA